MSASQERSNELPDDSAFHQDNMAAVLTIQLARIYDMLAVIARNTNKEEAEKMIELHTRGIFLCPPPAFIPWNDEEESQSLPSE